MKQFQKWICMISRSLILLILLAAKIMRAFFMKHLQKSCEFIQQKQFCYNTLNFFTGIFEVFWLLLNT